MGGILIAAATSLHLYLYGRITGLSGILNGLIHSNCDNLLTWKMTFFVGLITCPNVLKLVCGNSISLGSWTITFFDSNIYSYNNWLAWIVGGLLVGFGTRLGNGCTSCHGVCGIPRLSKRSITATCIFICSGILMATFKGQLNIL